MSVSGMKAERQRYTTDMKAQEAPESGQFLGQTVLVAGGGGIVGSAIVALVLREGGTVFAVRVRGATPLFLDAPWTH